MPVRVWVAMTRRKVEFMSNDLTTGNNLGTVSYLKVMELKCIN